MKHLGDITKINGYDAPVVDVIIGGSPCQDLSVAGKRAGLSGQRSGLFMEQIRIIKEMRDHDRISGRAGRFLRPRYMVWENVPGAFSSQNGEDFRAVLEETARIADESAAIPGPEKGKWANSGCIMGDGWSIAWRVLDAQFWGVPQRRRRIALIADFGGYTAPEILFERNGLPGDIEESGAPGEGAATDAQGGTYPAIARSLTARNDGSPCIDRGPQIVCAGFSGKAGAKSGGVAYQNECAPTLKAEQDSHVICLPINDKATRYQGGGDTRNGDGSGNGLGIGADGDPSPTITAGDRNAVCVHPVIAGTICASGAGTNRPAGQANETDLCIVQAIDCRNDAVGSVSGTLQAKTNGGQSLNCINPIMAAGYKAFGEYVQTDVCKSLLKSDDITTGDLIVGTAVRRLTPLECERLQGYPDGWTLIPDYIDGNGKKKTVSDSARYKALGNSIALPPWKWVLKRLCSHYERDATMASLFDGIGGFPLIWEQLNGRGTCLWSSEIEEFPIAVTKYRFERSE